MGWVRSQARCGLRCCVFGLVALAAGLFITSDAADARHYRRIYVHTVRHVEMRHVEMRHVAHVHYRSRHAEEYAPPFSSLVIDGNSGEVLQASNADAIRHPASLTKIMTLYLLFEELEAGRIRLDTPLKVSARGAEQAPSKLGLRPGQTIAVEDAIKAVVTKSANDAAVTIAENLAGSEEEFARAMTQKARALGMAHTTYVNASGLPDDDQLTTARDLALLGRAIADRFPRYYRYFSTPAFVYHGEAMRNHNHLLGSVAGVDGIKTGYTRASGFNLVTSVHRDGRYLVAVVLGGHSAFARDARMRELINSHMREASLRRSATRVAERSEETDRRRPEPQLPAPAKAPVASRVDPMATATVSARMPASSSEPIHPVMVKTISYRTAPTPTAALAPMPALMPVAARAAAPTPPAAAPSPSAPAPAARASITQPGDGSRTLVVASAEPGEIATGSKAEPQTVAAAPKADIAKRDIAKADLAKPEIAKPDIAKPEIAKPDIAKPEIAKPEIAKAEIAKADSAKADMAKVEIAKTEPAAPQAHPHGGWVIQIGAFDAEAEARQHLSAAQSQAHSTLAAAEPFTERVQKGDKALYRARFAGFDRSAAEAACRELKRSEFECMAVRN
jgi:D-alanyl-D-alanine carboxypeptidase